MKLFRGVFVFLLVLTAFPAVIFAAEADAPAVPAAGANGPVEVGYNPETGQIILPSEVGIGDSYNYYYQQMQQQQQQANILNDGSPLSSATSDPQNDYRQYEEYQHSLQEAREERERIQQWEKMDKEIKLRRYDALVFDMRKSFEEAKDATNPFIGEQGYVIYPYGEVVPVITCRPLRMTDIALEPGESIMGIHAGDTTRWQFSPSQSMKNGQAVSHIVVKPLQPGISTNMLIHTDRRTYNLDFTSTDGVNYLRGVAFSYNMNDLSTIFVNSQNAARPQKALEDELQSGTDSLDFEELYTQYAIDNRGKVDWSPNAVFDDGLKTYIRMPVRFSETPAFYIVVDRKPAMANYRVKGRYYIVDRLFDKAYLRVGSKTVTITRKEKLAETNIKANREEEILRQAEKQAEKRRYR